MFFSDSNSTASLSNQSGQITETPPKTEEVTTFTDRVNTPVLQSHNPSFSDTRIRTAFQTPTNPPHRDTSTKSIEKSSRPTRIPTEESADSHLLQSQSSLGSQNTRSNHNNSQIVDCSKDFQRKPSTEIFYADSCAMQELTSEEVLTKSSLLNVNQILFSLSNSSPAFQP